MLAVRIIQPSCLKGRGGLMEKDYFFVEKKDKVLWTYIDYCGLSDKISLSAATHVINV